MSSVSHRPCQTSLEMSPFSALIFLFFVDGLARSGALRSRSAERLGLRGGPGYRRPRRRRQFHLSSFIARRAASRHGVIRPRHLLCQAGHQQEVLFSESDAPDLIRSSLQRWIRGWALLLAVLEVLNVAFNLTILMRTGGFAFTEVVSANFVLAGLLAAASGLAIASVASLGSQVQYTERFFASLRMTR